MREWLLLAGTVLMVAVGLVLAAALGVIGAAAFILWVLV